MTQQPESTDPIASAGQIDDPDQPTTVKGQDDSRAGRDTQPDESSADGDPDQPGAAPRTSRPTGHDDAARAASTAPGTTAPTASADATREDHTRHGGKPPKAIQETGVPVADREAARERDVRDVDSEALAGTRKFQPRPGDENPNVSDNPANFPDHRGPDGVSAQDDRGRSEAERGGKNTAQYETPESMPATEPVRHSRLVEERVQEQERDYDLGTTEEGERYLTPRDLPEA
ncbi:hypothetical protein CWC38_06785 [Kocuria tytonicola]|uniref:hypothetical protein n=1 Tax=Kocuria tytonicola TaxID=2055946 RepID=UPI000EF91684|nr:hypothetical protein [Kocuria tytonicola]RLZ03242.1 hypothetical protein CWC38_06785 [Kocuria tytonicola]